MGDNPVPADIKKGLEGVLVGETKICMIDGENGKLLYRGYNIADLAQYSTFEEVSYLLIYGQMPTSKELAGFKKKLVEKRRLPHHIIDMMHTFFRDMTPMEALRTCCSALGHHDSEQESLSYEDNREIGIDLIAKFPTIVAAYHRIRKGSYPLPPRSDLSHAGNFLYMLTGEIPDAISERAMDMDFILHAEHDFNASTFAARVTISTLSDVHSGATSALGGLKGPLHGGAAQEVAEMLKEIGSLDKCESYIKKKLAIHAKVMGFGHRVYKTYDPRAKELKKMAYKISSMKGDMKWYEMSIKIEELMMSLKGLNPNVDFYSATVYHHLGLPLDLDTPIFAIGRMPGWMAHMLEQYADNRLIRPRAKYVGAWDVPYVPLEKRKNNVLKKLVAPKKIKVDVNKQLRHVVKR